MGFRGKRNRVILCSVLIIAMFTIFSPNVQFQLTVVHEGDWETVEYIDGIEDLNTEPPMIIEGKLVHQNFIPAATETNYVDAVQSQTYGATAGFALGMAVDDNTHSTLTEASYVSASYTTKTSYTGGSLPGGWTNTNWIFGASYVYIMGIALTTGNFYTNTHDMSSYDGVRVKFDWKNEGSRTTELGDLECNSYEGGNNVWFESPVGNQGSFTNELRDSAWASTFWKVTFTASGLDGDIDTWEGFQVDNIYLQGKTDNTYYRFEAVYRFDSVEYTYGLEKLYVDYDSGTSTEGLQYYGGTTTNPSSYIGGTSGVEPDTSFDISGELTGTPFYVKIVDLTQTDTDRDTWRINRLYIFVEANPPVIDSASVCTNLDDGDNLYARYKTYIFTSNVSDADGYADIVDVYLYCTDYDYVSLRWGVKYDEATDVFSETGDATQKARIELDTSGSSAVKSGDDIDITWLIKIEWTAAPYVYTDDDLKTWVIDELGPYVGREDDVNYDYIGEVSFYVPGAGSTITINDGSGTIYRGNYNTVGGITASGTIYYSSSSRCPPIDEIDVWVTCPDTPDTDWNATNYEASGGTFSVAVDSDDVVTGSLTTYTGKVVKQGVASSGTDFAEGTNTGTYMADRIQVQSYSVSDARVNINDNVDIDVYLWYDYDNSNVTDGTVTINGYSAELQWGSDLWRITRTNASVNSVTYNNVQATGNTHGITIEDQNEQNQQVIWDRVQVQSYTVTDDWVNINDNVNIDFLVWYEFDSTPVTDGDFTLNGYDATHQGSGVWRIPRTSTSPTMVNYNTVLVSAANTHGIDVEDQNGKSRQVVWDSVTITMTDPTDQRQNIGANATGIHITITMDYNGTAYGGTATMNNTDYNGDGTVVRWGYTVSSVNGGTEGITTISSNDETYMIWDRILILTTVVYDARIDYGTQSIISVTAQLEYTTGGIHSLGSGDVLYLNDTSMSWNGSHFTLNPQFSVVGLWSFFVNSSSANEATHGITVVNLDGNSVNVIWDRIQISTTVSTDGRIDYGTTTMINVTATLEYVAHTLGSGDTLYMNDTLMTWDTDHFYLITGSYNIIDLINYFVNSSSANEATHGITVINLDGNSADVIWDRIIISTTVSTDGRIDYGTTTTINVTATLEYAAHTLGSGDTLYMNDTSMTWDTDHFYLVIGAYNIVDIINYFVNSSSANEATHGITVVNLDGNSANVIWDRIKILTTTATDGRIDYGTTTTINVTAVLEYDSHALISGDTLYMNGTQMTWDTDHFYLTTGSYSIVSLINYFVNSSSANEATHGITVINLDGNNADVIWDRILILTTAVTDGRINYGLDDTTLNVTAELEYDSHTLESGDTLYMNGTSMTWDTDHFYLVTGIYSIADLINYFVNSSSANEVTYGITVINLDGNSANVIWDRVIWYTYTRNATADGGRMTNCTSVNIGETVNITARFLFEYDLSAISTQIYLEGETMTYIADGYWYLEVSNETSAYGQHYQFNSFTNPSNTYGITVMNTNSKDFYIIWDSIYIDSSGSGVEPDARHNTGEYPILYVTAKLRYDDDPLDTTSDYIKLAGQTFQWNGSYLVNNTFTLDQVGQFTLGTNDTGHNENTYGITEIEYYSFTTIFDRVFVYAMWSPTEADNRTNYGDTETVYVSFVSEYDNSSMTAGTFELNSTGMSYVSGSIWQKTGYSYSAVVNYTFNVNSASWSAYGIDQINYNGWNVTYYYIVWDRIQVQTTVVDDGRVDYGTAAQIRVTLWLDYDNSYLGSGDTVTLNGTGMSWDVGNSWFELDRTFSIIDIWNFYVNSTSEATYGITALDLNGQNVDVIWDRVYLTGIYVSDSRASYGTDVNVTVTAKSEYSDVALGSGDSIYINGTLAIWDSTHSVFNVTYSYSEVVNKTFHVTAVNEATYDITAITNDTHVWIIWDRLKITDFAVDNVIPDPLQMIFINLTLVYEFDDAEFHFDNGTITMIAYNVTWDVEESKGMHWNDTNWQFNHTMPAGVGVIRNFNISAFTDSVYAIAVINWNGFDNVTAGSDRVIVVSYVVSDDRDDINDYIWVNVTLQLESNGTAIVDGDVVVNGYIFTHISGGDWRYNTTQASVTSIDFDTVVAENNTYGIETVNQNGQYTTIIWDRIVITNFWVIDNRTDVSTDVQIRLTAELDFDDTSLGSGDTIYINSTLATWDNINLRFYISENYATALNYTYELTSITEITYTITEVTNTSYVWQIWDQFVLTRFNSTDADGRTNLDVTEYIHFGMKWDYDNEVFQSGNGTIYLNSTLLTWNASQSCWSMSWVNSTPVSYVFAYASHTDNIHGITVIDWGSYDNVTQSWDRIGVVVSTNMTWTVAGYNVMISYTSTYESDGVTWGGNATVANTSLVITSRPRNENLTFSVVVNKTFYATAISADPNGVTGFTTTTVWCVWDNITATSMYGAEVSGASKIFKISFGDLRWQFNGSGIGADWICYNIRNGTAQLPATTLSSSYLEPLLQEVPIPLTWDYILYSNNATKIIGSRAYNFQWYSVTHLVVATQNIMEENTEILDTTIVISGTTNVDFTWAVYNDTAPTGETGTVTDADDWRISFNMIMTYGNHSYGIYCDAGASGNRWINSTYFINFDVNIDPPEVRGASVEVRGVINIACSYYIYHEDVYSDETGSLTPTTISFFFTKMTSAGLHNYSLYFNVSATVAKWKNGSYYVDPTWDYCRVTLYNSEGTGLDVDHFIVYVNGTRYYGNEFYGRTDYDYNITVTDYFGYTIHSSTYGYSRNLDVGLAFYIYKVKSELQGQAVYFNLTRTGGARFSQHLLPDEIIIYYLVAGEYTYEFRKVSTPGGDIYVYYDGTFTLSYDKTHIIDGTNLRDLQNTVELMPAGKADTKPMETALSGIIDMISIMQLGMWGLAFLIVIGMAATATDEEVLTKDGKVIKKRKIPKQLKRFAFGRGAQNPKSKKIPKGAGRKSWKGVAFRDEMVDWRKKK